MPGMGMCDRVGDIVYAAAWSDPKDIVLRFCKDQPWMASYLESLEDSGQPSQKKRGHPSFFLKVLQSKQELSKDEIKELSVI